MDLGFKDVHILVTGMSCSVQQTQLLRGNNGTGASGGIGLETTRQFVGTRSPYEHRNLGVTDSCEYIAHGARVTAHYNTNSTSLDGLIGESRADNIQKSQADLGAEGDTIRMFGEINKGRFGPVQVVIVNHAIYVTEDVPLSQMSLGQWDRTINANLTSSFLVVREYLKGLEILGDDGAKDKAAIILVGSTAGKYGESGHADYSATKSGKLLSSGDFQRVLMGISHDVWPHDDAEE